MPPHGMALKQAPKPGKRATAVPRAGAKPPVREAVLRELAASPRKPARRLGR
jgi:hypothetical protein